MKCKINKVPQCKNSRSDLRTVPAVSCSLTTFLFPVFSKFSINTVNFWFCWWQWQISKHMNHNLGMQSGTFCFFPEAGSPLRMLASMASISFTIKPNSLSQKLNTSWERERKEEDDDRATSLSKEQSQYLCSCVCEPRYLENKNLLGNREGLAVELLDKLGGHLVWVVGGRVSTLLLQEVNFDCHGANALLGLVKVVVGHLGDRQGQIDLRSSSYTGPTDDGTAIKQPNRTCRINKCVILD